MILVTGAGGTVGRALVEELSARGERFRAAHHSAEKVERARSRGQDAVQVDYAKPHTLSQALQGANVVFLLGTGGSSGQVEAETNVVEAARSAGVERLVKLSVLEATANSFAFGRTHRAIECHIEASGFSWTFLRPNSYMQNFITFMGDSIRTQSAFFEPAADAKISHVDVRDIARVATEVLTSSGHDRKAYQLTGPEALSYADAAATLSRVLGRRISYVAVTDEAAKQAMLDLGMPEAYTDDIIDLNRLFRTGAAARLETGVRDVTRREPLTFEQFVRDHAEAWAPSASSSPVQLT